jgi:hypothetical protein
MATGHPHVPEHLHHAGEAARLRESERALRLTSVIHIAEATALLLGITLLAAVGALMIIL